MTASGLIATPIARATMPATIGCFAPVATRTTASISGKQKRLTPSTNCHFTEIATV
jgi:hypothetical protein